MVDNFKIGSKHFSQSEWIGLTIEDAIKKSETEGLTWRIVEEDGMSRISTRDLKANRVNFRIRDKKIYRAFIG